MWLIDLLEKGRALAERIPYSFVALLARLAAANVFWRSGQTKVEGFFQLKENTFFLFQEEYKVPLLPPDLAAYMATVAEHVFPVLLVAGLAAAASNNATSDSWTTAPAESNRVSFAPCQNCGGSPRRRGSRMAAGVLPSPTAPLVIPELSSLCRKSLPSGRRATQSVNVPPASIQNCQRDIGKTGKSGNDEP